MRATVHRVLALFLGWLFLGAIVVADDSCGQAGNLTYNCNFDRFVDRGNGISTPDGWLPWITMGSPAFDADLHGSAPGAPAQRIWSDGGSWTAGLYQQMPVTPGKAYIARLLWSPSTCDDVERRIGLDPAGGTDPLSPRVVWGASCWVRDRMPDLQVSAYAEGETLTIFVWTHHPTSYGADQVFLDGVVMVEDPALPPRPTAPPTSLPTSTSTRKPTKVPPRAQSTATDTAVPPSATPTKVRPTAPPVLTQTPVPTQTPAPTHTATAPPNPTATATLAPPTDTPPPSRTPLPTVMVVGRTLAGSEGGAGDRGLPAAGARTPAGSRTPLLYVAAVALLGVALCGMGLAWLRARSRTLAGAGSDPGEPLSGAGDGG